ncbi:MAG: helix-turn-helix domain-containing protein [candidate division NC10 bacterium]|nr:helix-turn-helix domain-containing protein [candidate division NC10 bacterium]
MSDEKPLSTGEVARLLHVSPVTVRCWIRAGKLPAYRVPGGHYRIARSEFRIFLDVLLPTIGGASLLKAIKRRDPEAVVVLITGYPHHDETLAALEYGPAMLLRKPIKLTDIHAVLEIVFKE